MTKQQGLERSTLSTNLYEQLVLDSESLKEGWDDDFAKFDSKSNGANSYPDVRPYAGNSGATETDENYFYDENAEGDKKDVKIDGPNKISGSRPLSDEDFMVGTERNFVQPQGTVLSSNADRSKWKDQKESQILKQGSEIRHQANEGTLESALFGSKDEPLKSGVFSQKDDVQSDSFVKNQGTDLKPSQLEESGKPQSENSDQILNSGFDLKQQGTDGGPSGNNAIKLLL